MEEANLPDVLEHGTLREYVELAFLRAARGSSNQGCVVGPMEEYLDDLRTLTLKGTPFGVFRV